MSGAGTPSWPEANQRYLSAALALVRAALERHAARARGEPGDEAAVAVLQRQLAAAAAAMPAPAALERLCALFGLSPFERDILLLGAGIELDADFASLCANAHGDTGRPYPTFSLALAALPEAHWSALTPAAPLRRWRLLEVVGSQALTQNPLRLDERIVHYLVGLQYLDERLAGLVETPGGSDAALVPSHQLVAEQLAVAWTRAVDGAPLPVVQLCGVEPAGKQAIAAAACAGLGLGLGIMPATVIPLTPAELEGLLRLWEREATLSAAVLLLDCDSLDSGDTARMSSVLRLIEQIRQPLIVACRERLPLWRRSVITLDVRKPSAGEQCRVWQAALGARAAYVNGQVEVLTAQFNLSAAGIRAACAEALVRGGEPESAEPLAAQLWEICRRQARPRLDDLAQRMTPAAGWDDLVLPETQRQILREIAAHVRQRARVYEAWGFAAKSLRGLGISALFAGASGTGKTLAAEVLANELHLDLYRIDLSQVVSKYIGETEKNLRQVFDAAEAGGAILLFDEADALFGKRSEVKDSHDRYANIEISYLLQRMEAYKGLAILTTNMKSAIDSAFLRRIRFIVQFPFPDAPRRAEIWRRIFPAPTPTAALDIDRLARLNLAGGNIHNIALNAAFLAADADEPVRMKHLLQAVRGEYAKLEKPLTEVEIGGLE
jgi:hypothetical protein